MPNGISIADVERDTGLGKDTLRVWERRYGFPQPRRNALGERRYSPDQVEKLQVIKRLIDVGRRPGALVSRPIGELHSLSDALGEAPRADGRRDAEVDALLRLLAEGMLPALRHALAVAHARLGSREFVLDIMAPLTCRKSSTHGSVSRRSTTSRWRRAWAASPERRRRLHLFRGHLHERHFQA